MGLWLVRPKQVHVFIEVRLQQRHVQFARQRWFLHGIPQSGYGMAHGRCTNHHPVFSFKQMPKPIFTRRYQSTTLAFAGASTVCRGVATGQMSALFCFFLPVRVHLWDVFDFMHDVIGKARITGLSTSTKKLTQSNGAINVDHGRWCFGGVFVLPDFRPCGTQTT